MRINRDSAHTVVEDSTFNMSDEEQEGNDVDKSGEISTDEKERVEKIRKEIEKFKFYLEDFRELVDRIILKK